MTSVVYLEQCLEGLQNLPSELKRNFSLMRDLDARSQNIINEIDQRSKGYLQSVVSLSSKERTTQLTEINQLFSKSHELADDKIQLANQTYEMVDQHIRRLDSDLSQFETCLKHGSFDFSSASKDVVKCQNGKHNKGENDSDELPKKRRKKGSLPADDLMPSSPASMLPLVGLASPSGVLDMPVDPNEPTYCICHQVSYGEMIGCDNPDCPVEWFHFSCVGLTTKPKGKWFCPKCSAVLSKH